MSLARLLRQASLARLGVSVTYVPLHEEGIGAAPGADASGEEASGEEGAAEGEAVPADS